MGLNLFPKYSNVEYMALENAECVRFWWEAGALHDVQIWFNYRIYSQGCGDVYPLPVYRYLETLLIIWYPRYYGVNWSYTLVHINTQLFAFRGKYDVSYLLWMKLFGAPVILCLWMRSWKWLIYLDTSCFWLKNKAFRNYLVCLLLTKFYCEFLRD